MPLARRALVIDEDVGVRRSLVQVLSGLGFQVVEASSARAGLTEAHHFTPDVVVLDLSVTDISALQVLRTIASEPAPRPPVVLMGERVAVDVAVEAMKLGAKDVLSKPLDTERVKSAVLGAIEKSDLARDIARLESLIGPSLATESFVAHSPAMAALVEKLDRLSTVEMPVMIIGEKGTGKAAVARRLHASSPRASKPFVIVPDADPAAVEQSLFGTNGRPSAFAQAADGVLFIESIASLGSSGQDRLAHVLAELSAARTSGQPVTAPRLIVAAERELTALVESGQVKEELARRLSPLTVQVPALRERRADIADLVAQIANRAARQTRSTPVVFEQELITFFTEQSWPRNLRELEAATLRAIALSRGGRVRLEDLTEARAPQAAAASAPQQRGWSPTLDGSGEVQRYDNYEAEIFRFALDRAGGCVSRAAEMLGVGRATMYRKMRSYDIDAPPVSERAIVRSGRRRQVEGSEGTPGRGEGDSVAHHAA